MINKPLISILIILLSFQFNSIAQPNGMPPFQRCYAFPWYDYNTCEQYIITQIDEKKSTESYDDFETTAGKIIVNKNNRFGILNCDLSTFIPCEFDSVFSLYSVNDFFWSIQQNDSTYLLSWDGDTILSTDFEAIDLNLGHDINRFNNTRFTEYFQPLSPSLFGVTKNDKRGVIRKDGSILFPPIYDKIEIFVLNTKMVDPNNRQWNYTPFFFWALRSNDERIFKSFDGQTIYSDRSNSSFTDIILLNELKEPIVAVKNAKNESYRILNVRTGKLSDSTYFDVSKSRNGYYFLAKQFKNSRENLFLNHEMKVIYKTEQHEANSFYPMYPDLYMYRSTVTIGNVGIIHLNGKHIIPPNYRFIQPKINGLDIYFWATPTTNSDPNKYNAITKFHVFDTTGTLLNKIEVFEPNYNAKLSSTASAFFKGQSIDLYVIRSNNNPVTINLYWTSNKGKWGAFNAKGHQVIPYIYDDYKETVNIDIGGDKQLGHIVEKGNHLGVVNSVGKIIHPFEYSIYEVNWKNTSLNYYTKNGISTLTTKTDGIIIEKFDTVLIHEVYNYYGEKTRLSPSQTKRTRDIANDIFISKNDSLYHLVNDRLILCDASHLDFDNPMLPIGHYFLNEYGGLHKFPIDSETALISNFLIAIHDSTTQIISLTGEQISTFKHFKCVRNYDNHLLVQFTNYKVGMLALDGKNWLVAPNYYDVIKSKHPKQFWVNTKKVLSGSRDDMKGNWLLIDDLGNALLDSTVFNYPPTVQPKSANTAIFSTGLKYGILDETNIAILEPVYDFITPADILGTYFINKNNKWALFHHSGVTSGAYDEIIGSESLTLFKAYTYTETDTLISILNFDIHLGFVELNTPQNYSTLITEINLTALIDSLVEPTSVKDRNQLAKLWDQVNVSDQYEKPLRPFNNIILLQAFNKPVSKIRSTNLTFNYPHFRLDYKFRNSKLIADQVNSDNVHWQFHNFHYKHEYPQPSERHKLRYSKSAVYSKVIFPKSSVDRSSFIMNYWLTAEEAIPLKFDDLFKNPQKAQKFFYKFIEEYATEHQIFGASCPNFSQIFERYIQNFYFSKGGLYFGQYISETALKNDVFVPYEAFSKYLKNIYQIEGGW